MSLKPMKRYRFICRVNPLTAVWQQIAWLVLTVLTCGLAAPVFAYYFVKYIIDRTEIEEI